MQLGEDTRLLWKEAKRLAASEQQMSQSRYLARSFQPGLTPQICFDFLPFGSNEFANQL